jgi:hypothetical protein
MLHVRYLKQTLLNAYFYCVDACTLLRAELYHTSCTLLQHSTHVTVADSHHSGYGTALILVVVLNSYRYHIVLIAILVLTVPGSYFCS